jgi:ATP phosphoribosyltransferase
VKRGVYFTQERNDAIKLGIPSKGRGQLQVWKLLESCKILPPFSEDLRENPPSLDKSIIVVAERQLDIARDLGKTNLNIGIVGEDLLKESGYSLEKVCKLGMGVCKVSLITKPNFRPTGSMRIATKLPNITRQLLEEMKWKAEIIEREGALETAIEQGIADAIVDQVAELWRVLD